MTDDSYYFNECVEHINNIVDVKFLERLKNKIDTIIENMPKNI